jgi:chaperonin cofactor prefoldin
MVDRQGPPAALAANGFAADGRIVRDSHPPARPGTRPGGGVLMSRVALNRLVRRALVLVATVAVIGVAAGTVQVAAVWRADAAPLDTAPVSMSSINTDMEAEVARTGTLKSQIDDVTGQLATLKDAVLTANDAMNGGAESAATLQQQLDTAKTKLQKLQSQLKGAQARLSALNSAAARQAALNAAARRSRPATSTVAAAPVSHENGD